MPTKKSPARLSAAAVDGKRFASIPEAAEHFAVHPATIRKWTADKVIRTYRIGNLIRVDLAEIDRAMAGETA
jgi:excisionase family DNA binding protein